MKEPTNPQQLNWNSLVCVKTSRFFLDCYPTPVNLSGRSLQLAFVRSREVCRGKTPYAINIFKNWVFICQQ